MRRRQRRLVSRDGVRRLRGGGSDRCGWNTSERRVRRRRPRLDGPDADKRRRRVRRKTGRQAGRSLRRLRRHCDTGDRKPLDWRDGVGQWLRVLSHWLPLAWGVGGLLLLGDERVKGTRHRLIERVEERSEFVDGRRADDVRHRDRLGRVGRRSRRAEPGQGSAEAGEHRRWPGRRHRRRSGGDGRLGDGRSRVRYGGRLARRFGREGRSWWRRQCDAGEPRDRCRGVRTRSNPAAFRWSLQEQHTTKRDSDNDNAK